MNKSIEHRVIKTIAEQFALDVVDFDVKTSFEILGADSLDVVELVMALEDEFNKDVFENDAVRAISNWQDKGFCQPNQAVTPAQTKVKGRTTMKKPEKTFVVRGFSYSQEPTFHAPTGVIEDKETFKEIVVKTQAEAIVAMLADDAIGEMSSIGIMQQDNNLVIVGYGAASNDTRNVLNVFDLQIELAITDKLEVKAVKSDIREIVKRWAEKSRIRGIRGFRASAIKTPTYEYFADSTQVRIQVIIGNAVVYSGNSADITPRDSNFICDDLRLLSKELTKRLGGQFAALVVNSPAIGRKVQIS